MRDFIFVLYIVLYVCLGVFIAGMILPDDENAWFVGIFWPFILLFAAPILVIKTAQMTGQAVGKFFRRFTRKGDKRDERL